LDQLEELMHANTPGAVRAWVHSRPEEHADLLLMDERSGVKLASGGGLEVNGTLGFLVHAARIGLIDIDAAPDSLEATDFRYAPQLLQQTKQRAQERT
jgi:predicted nucleic acid-binding protein